MAGIHRTAQAVWHGTGKDGTGEVSTQSGVLQSTPLSFNRRFGDEPGTNPEELIAAAHAGCFSMALAFALEKAGFKPAKLETAAKVTLDREGEGFRISRSALTLTATVPGVDRAAFEQIALGAKANCPVSKVINADITLDWTLA